MVNLETVKYTKKKIKLPSVSLSRDNLYKYFDVFPPNLLFVFTSTLYKFFSQFLKTCVSHAVILFENIFYTNKSISKHLEECHVLFFYFFE